MQRARDKIGRCGSPMVGSHLLSTCGDRETKAIRFLNNTTLDDIINNEVTVMLVASPGSNDIEAVEFCRVFVKDGEPHIDFARHAPGDYVAPLPGDAIVSRNETELAMGRYAVILSRQSEAGRMLVKLLGENDRGSR